MKRYISIFLTLAVILCSLSLLFSCGGKGNGDKRLSGSYFSEKLNYGYEFDGDSITQFWSDGSRESTCTYRIKGDSITINSGNSSRADYTVADGYIVIGGISYYPADDSCIYNDSTLEGLFEAAMTNRSFLFEDGNVTLLVENAAMSTAPFSIEDDEILMYEVYTLTFEKEKNSIIIGGEVFIKSKPADK